MTTSKKALAEYLGVEPGQIVKMREDAGNVIAIVDKGIKGTPKLVIPLSDLKKPAPPKEPDAPEDEKDEADDLNDLTVAELQEIARERDISYSGLRKSELIEALNDD